LGPGAVRRSPNSDIRDTDARVGVQLLASVLEHNGFRVSDPAATDWQFAALQLQTPRLARMGQAHSLRLRD